MIFRSAFIRARRRFAALRQDAFQLLRRIFAGLPPSGFQWRRSISPGRVSGYHTESGRSRPQCPGLRVRAARLSTGIEGGWEYDFVEHRLRDKIALHAMGFETRLSASVTVLAWQAAATRSRSVRPETASCGLGGGGGHQPLVGTDVEVALARRICCSRACRVSKAGFAIQIHGAADNAARHLAHQHLACST